jgi:hypothetical protein
MTEPKTQIEQAKTLENAIAENLKPPLDRLHLTNREAYDRRLFTKGWKSHEAATRGLRDVANLENERLRDVLHRDQTGLAKGLADVADILKCYDWILRGEWGSYEYQEQTAETMRSEASNLISECSAIAKKALDESGKLAHAECCGRSSKPVHLENADDFWLCDKCGGKHSVEVKFCRAPRLPKM